LDGGPYTFVWRDALTQKVREGGRIVNVHALVATGVNADGNREILGLEVTTSEDGAGWLALAEQNDEWAEQRRYMGLEILAARQRVGTKTETSDVNVAMYAIAA
jgi:hypothetical protein